jgi:hypothetical protein
LSTKSIPNMSEKSSTKRTNKGIELEGQFNDLEIKLIEHFEGIRARQMDKKIMKGFWNTLAISGSSPPTMEGATLCCLNDKLYLYGGLSTDVYSDLRICNFETKKWSIVASDNEIYDIPLARYGHTMDVYGDNLVIFGGAGAYNHTAKMRISYKDIRIFDTISSKWITDFDKSGPKAKFPFQRMYHASAVYGNILLIHGGLNTEDRSSFNDLFMYDLEI